MTDRTLLIVEDDPGLQKQMRWCFENTAVLTAANRTQAITLADQHQPAVITLDLGLPPDAGGTTEGFALLAHFARHHPFAKVVVITGREEREHALEAVAQGAYDYYQKPIDAQTLQFVVERAFKHAALESEIRTLRQRNDNELLPGFIADSPVMRNLCRQIERVAAADVSVLITGETGTGKEVVATNLHRLSRRADGPLITINCAAIPENLLESELFGHEKGAFTGAHARKIGKVEAADGGTLFLDEIGDMPLPLQAKILRFVQERSFERVGSTQSLSTDVRVISATHQDLPGMISGGDFREDLFYRLGEINLQLPPLKERGGDVLLIAAHLLSDAQAKSGSQRQLHLSKDALAAIEAWDWPGNIREMENRLRRAAILCESDEITALDLELSTEYAAPVRRLKDVRAMAEREAIQAALLTTGYNISEAARLLGVSRPTLYNMMDKYDVSSDHSVAEQN